VKALGGAEEHTQVPFGFAQGRLSTPLKYASLSDKVYWNQSRSF